MQFASPFFGVFDVFVAFLVVVDVVFFLFFFKLLFPLLSCYESI